MGKGGSWIGIDIGTMGIKFAKLSGYKLEDWGSVPLPQGSIAAGVIKDFAAVSKAISELFNKRGIKRRRVVSCVGGRETVIRTMTLPRLEKKEFEKFLVWEIERFLPFPVEDAVYNYQILRSFRDGEGEKLEVMVVVTRKSLSRAIYEAFKGAEIELEAIEALPFPLLRSAELSRIKDGFMIIDMGAGTTDMAVVRENNIVLFRSIPIGGNSFTSAISASAKLDFSTAEKLKVDSSFAEIREYVSDVLSNLTDEVRRCFDYVIGQFKENIVSVIYLTGGGCAFKGFDVFLEGMFGISTRRLDPLKGLQLRTPVGELDELKSRWSLAIGLALRGVH